MLVIGGITAVVATVNVLEAFEYVDWDIARWILPAVLCLLILRDIASEL
jgi:hypothetical protein